MARFVGISTPNFRGFIHTPGINRAWPSSLAGPLSTQP